MKHKIITPQIICLILFFLTSCISGIDNNPKDEEKSQLDSLTTFDGSKAYQYIQQQMSFGPRTPGSTGHEQTKDLILTALNEYQWSTTIQAGDFMGFKINNIIGKMGNGKPWIILGAHYDTRIFADRDPNPEKQNEPVPGANDGASGVAVLLELARIIPKEVQREIWLVFFDAEDNGGIENREWIMGSRYFVNQLASRPDMMILIDMIGDENLNIYFEKNSNQDLAKEIWQVANHLGYGDQFISEQKYAIIDDHLPFLQAGIPAVDIIDFDYPYFHTTEDTIDKVSTNSLQIIGDTLLTWLTMYSH